MIEPYTVDKWVLTDADYNEMGWHDCHIHAITFSQDTFELLLDLDYIWQWVPPEAGETYYKFWISPATLVFQNVYDLELTSDRLAFEINAIERAETRPPFNGKYIGRAKEWRWQIDCHDGDICFWSAGYCQYIRNTPLLSNNLKLGGDKRGGISFHKGKVNVP